MLTSEQIARAKREFQYSAPGNIHHEHDDCIRIAYEWLDAQIKLGRTQRGYVALKHIIEEWGGRYVSQNDVEIAAHLHPEVRGIYPAFNLSRKAVEPCTSRLKGIEQANRMPGYRDNHSSANYRSRELRAG
ncbi:hypothetical protein MMMDOFMJ_3147 [Methylobacterium gnaphalii]|uniref:Uncharacterized protein n=1 Tax=Methylobacterium gnaphalii TaxID=1010610 RepID=A0A512JRG8_9HYPH|nr:hypothetical protein MGN01_43900 [Methylobacterium gnaphalii]GJD70205.1 hypothetical protein MMMDOFMJ_3147 [Methylobacterium gnaphalii]